MPDTVKEAWLADLADQYADIRRDLTDANAAAKAVQEQHDILEARLFAALEDANLRSIRTERGLFTLNDLAWAKVVDEAAAREWAEHNMPELLLLNRARLSPAIRPVLAGEENLPGVEPGQLPPGVDFTTSRKINFRKATT